MPVDLQSPPTPKAPASVSAFTRPRLLRCCRNNLVASILTLIVIPAAVIGIYPYVDFGHVTSIKLVLIVLLIVIGAPIWAISTLISTTKWLRSGLCAHPAVSWKEVGTPEECMASIDADMAAADQHQQIGTALLTSSWIVRYSRWSFESIPLAAVVWASMTSKTNKQNGKAVSKSYTLRLHLRNGNCFDVSGASEQVVENALNAIATRAPWAKLGKEHQNSWDNDRSGLIASVDSKRDEYCRPQEDVAATTATVAVIRRS